MLDAFRRFRGLSCRSRKTATRIHFQHPFLREARYTGWQCFNLASWGANCSKQQHARMQFSAWVVRFVKERLSGHALPRRGPYIGMRGSGCEWVMVATAVDGVFVVVCSQSGDRVAFTVVQNSLFDWRWSVTVGGLNESSCSLESEESFVWPKVWKDSLCVAYVRVCVCVVPSGGVRYCEL